jgi:hypothetical protein
MASEGTPVQYADKSLASLEESLSAHLATLSYVAHNKEPIAHQY